MSEHDTSARFLEAARRAGIELLRSNTGLARSLYGDRIIHLFPEGFPDYVGWRTVIVTPEMVGQTVALFAAVEMKAGKKPRAQKQVDWGDKLQKAGTLYACVHPHEIESTIAEFTRVAPPLTAQDLVETMTRHSLTIDALADALGVSSRVVNFWRKGVHPVPPYAANYLRGL